jgi:hypothetical protein
LRGVQTDRGGQKKKKPPENWGPRGAKDSIPFPGAIGRCVAAAIRAIHVRSKRRLPCRAFASRSAGSFDPRCGLQTRGCLQVVSLQLRSHFGMTQAIRSGVSLGLRRRCDQRGGENTPFIEQGQDRFFCPPTLHFHDLHDAEFALNLIWTQCRKRTNIPRRAGGLSLQSLEVGWPNTASIIHSAIRPGVSR